MIDAIKHLSDFAWYRRQPQQLHLHFRFSRFLFYSSAVGFIVLGTANAFIYLFRENPVLPHEVGMHIFALCSLLALCLGSAVNCVRLELYLLLMTQEQSQQSEEMTHDA